nr:MAG TPA_asm: hypothetical protein [Caudoviricetes sp.]
MEILTISTVAILTLTVATKGPLLHKMWKPSGTFEAPLFIP